MRYRGILPGRIHTITSKLHEGIFNPIVEGKSIGLVKVCNREDFQVKNSLYTYKERLDTPIGVRDLQLASGIEGISPDNLLLIRYLYSIARGTKLYHYRKDGRLSINGRELEVITGINMRGSYHGRPWADRFLDLKNIAAVLDDGCVYSVADYLEYREPSDEHILDAAFFDQLDNLLIKRNSYKRRIKPHHSSLIYSDARIIRDNPMALFFVEALISGLHRRGEYVPPLKEDGSSDAYTCERARIEYRVTYEHCLLKVPHLMFKLSQLQTANQKNKMLKRLRDAVEVLISDASDVREYFSDFEMDLPNVSSSTLNSIIYIKHRGVNRVLDYSEE